jgi:hypothetical protein
MKNAWKGLVIGALTGMVGGAAMDMASGARRRAAVVVGDLVERGAPAAKAATHKAAEALHDAHVPERAKSVTHRAAEALQDAHVPDRARDATSRASEALQDAQLPAKVREAARQAAGSDVAKRAKRVAGQVASGLSD